MNQKYGWMAIGLIGLTTACGGGFGGDGPTANGKIVNWPAGKTGSLRVAVGSGNTAVNGGAVTVDASGNFSSLPFPGSAAVTTSLTPAGTVTCANGSVTVTPNTVKAGGASLQILNGANASAGNVVEANIDPTTANNTPTVGTKLFVRLYADSNATISGTCTSGGVTTTYDINLSTGWNVVSLEATAVTGNAATAIKYGTGLSGDAKFYYSAGANPLSLNLFK